MEFFVLSVFSSKINHMKFSTTTLRTHCQVRHLILSITVSYQYSDWKYHKEIFSWYWKSQSLCNATVNTQDNLRHTAYEVSTKSAKRVEFWEWLKKSQSGNELLVFAEIKKIFEVWEENCFRFLRSAHSSNQTSYRRFVLVEHVLTVY